MTFDRVDYLKKRIMGAIVATANEAQVTQKDLAQRLETTQPRVSNLFNMQTEKFSLDSLFRYAYTLHIEVETYINGE